MRGSEAPQRQGKRRDRARGQQRSAFALPSEQSLEAVRKDQLEYARQQAAAERRAESAASAEHKNGKDVPALFGQVGRKTG